MSGVQRHSEIKDLSTLAREFFVHLRSPESTPSDQARLQAWLSESDAHAQAYAEVEQLWSSLDGLRHDPAILSMREQAREQLARTRWIRIGALATAACLVAGLWNAGLLSPNTWRDLGSKPSVYQTRVGQITTVSLSDGSTAILDTDSQIRFQNKSGGRSAELLKGRAMFMVSHDVTRPFTVHAAGKTVTALGTKFDVYLQDEALEVGLVEGKVSVQDERRSNARGKSGPSIILTPGYRLIATNSRWDIKPSAQEKPPWLERRLVFDEAPIGEIVGELNRYGDKKIVFASPGLASQRISAVVDSTDFGTFLASLEIMGAASVQTTGDGYVLSAPKAPRGG